MPEAILSKSFISSGNLARSGSKKNNWLRGKLQIDRTALRKRTKLRERLWSNKHGTQQLCTHGRNKRIKHKLSSLAFIGTQLLQKLQQQPNSSLHMVEINVSNITYQDLHLLVHNYPRSYKQWELHFTSQLQLGRETEHQESQKFCLTSSHWQ